VITHYADAIAARESLREPPVLTLVHNADIETQALEATAARLTQEVRQLSVLIRATRQDLDAQITVRKNKATALESALQSLAARVKR